MGAPANGPSTREEDVASARATRVLVSSMVAVNEASKRAGQVVLKLLVHWVDVSAIDDAIGLSASDVAAEMFEFLPMWKSRIGLVARKAI